MFFFVSPTGSPNASHTACQNVRRSCAFKKYINMNGKNAFCYTTAREGRRFPDQHGHKSDLVLSLWLVIVKVFSEGRI